MTRARRPRRLVGIAATLVLVALGGALLPTLAGAAPVGTISLQGQPAWSTLGDDVPLRLGIHTDGTPGLEIRAVVHDAVLSRIALERAISGDRLGSFLTSTDAPVDQLPAVGSDRVLTLPLQDPAAPRDPTRIRLSIGASPAGVFPVEIQLRDPSSDAVLDSFVTQLVALRPAAAGATPTEPLEVAWLWQVTASPSLSPTGTPSETFAGQIAAGGRIGRITTSLADAGDLPLTLVPGPETVDGLRAASDDEDAVAALATLRATSRSSTALSSSYTPTDAPSMLAAGLAPALDAQWTLGRRTLETGLGAAIDSTIAPPQRLDAAAIERMKATAGTTRLVVDPVSLAPADPPDQFTTASPFRLDVNGGSYDAVEVNESTSALLLRSGPDVLRAQQLLAVLAAISLEQPNRTRGIVLSTPLDWSPSTTRLRKLLDGLRDHPLLRVVPVSNLFDTVPSASVGNRPYTRTLAPLSPSRPPVTAAEYLRSRQRVDALASMIGDADPLVATQQHQLHLTPATGLPGTGRLVSTTRVASIAAALRTITGAVSAPASRTITLTSRRASIPISIENSSNRTIRVLVRLSSQKLELPDGDSRTVDLAPGNTTISFDVSARASGTFPVEISVTSPDGAIQLQDARYTVRSSAVSGVGLFLTLGAALFLGVWWLTHWRRGRRAQAVLSS